MNQFGELNSDVVLRKITNIQWKGANILEKR